MCTKTAGDVVSLVGQACHQGVHVKNVLNGNRWSAGPEPRSDPVLRGIRIEYLSEFPPLGIKADLAPQEVGDLRLGLPGARTEGGWGIRRSGFARPHLITLLFPALGLAHR